jgi:hypothetical protein
MANVHDKDGVFLDAIVDEIWIASDPQNSDTQIFDEEDTVLERKQER